MIDETPNSLSLSWTVAQGLFDSFVVQYRDPAGQPRAVPVAKDQRDVTIQGLEPGRKYKFLLYGIHGRQHLGPISVLGVTGEHEWAWEEGRCSGTSSDGNPRSPSKAGARAAKAGTRKGPGSGPLSPSPHAAQHCQLFPSLY